jgi:hypothetical protein
VGKILKPSLTLGLICPVQEIELAQPKFHIMSLVCVVSYVDIFSKGTIVNCYGHRHVRKLDYIPQMYRENSPQV